jgi:hypothetical protein
MGFLFQVESFAKKEKSKFNSASMQYPGNIPTYKGEK